LIAHTDCSLTLAATGWEELNQFLTKTRSLSNGFRQFLWHCNTGGGGGIQTCIGLSSKWNQPIVGLQTL